MIADGRRTHQGGRDVRHVCRHGLAEGCGRHPKVAYGEKKVSKICAFCNCSCVVVQLLAVCTVAFTHLETHLPAGTPHNMEWCWCLAVQTGSAACFIVNYIA